MICAGVPVAFAPPAVVPVAVAVGADRLIVAKETEAVALFVAVAVAVAGEILSAANDPDALALPPAEAVPAGAVMLIAASAHDADALPDALAAGAKTVSVENEPDPVVSPPADTGTNRFLVCGAKICQGFCANLSVSLNESQEPEMTT